VIIDTVARQQHAERLFWLVSLPCSAIFCAF